MLRILKAECELVSRLRQVRKQLFRGIAEARGHLMVFDLDIRDLASRTRESVDNRTSHSVLSISIFHQITLVHAKILRALGETKVNTAS